MRRFSKISGMTIVTCDYAFAIRSPGEPHVCGEEFRSASVPSIIPKQLEAAHWATRTSGVDREVEDLCPLHAERVGLVNKFKMPARRVQ